MVLSIVDQNIDLDASQRPGNRFGVAHIGFDGYGPARLGELGEGRLVASNGIDVVAFSEKREHDGFADTAGGAGDDGGFRAAVRHRYIRRK